MTTVQAIPSSFRAVWNEQNIHLHVPAPTAAEKVQKLAWDIFSILLWPLGLVRILGWTAHFIAKKLVLPAAWFYPGQIIERAKRIFAICCRNLQTQFHIQDHALFTPDGVKLHALHFRHCRANEQTPTVLFFQSNASVSHLGIYMWLIEEAVRRNTPCNFVIFDYRGVGNSEGDANSIRDLLIDGETALQFVRDGLQVPPHLVHWYGWSLGGAIGTHIKALHPECVGPLVNERSFKSLRSVGESIFPGLLKPLLCWLPYLAAKQGWDLDAPLEKLQGRTLLVYHPKDPTIPYATSAHQAALKASLQAEAIELYQTDEQIEKASKRFVDHHFESLDSYYAAPEIRADQAIADFILPH